MLKGTIDLVAPVVRRVESAIHWINLYPLNNSIGFASVYALDRIYPVDSIIHLLNNQSQCSKLKYLQVIEEAEHKWNLLQSIFLMINISRSCLEINNYILQQSVNVLVI